jgi:argininosuccinate lyase
MAEQRNKTGNESCDRAAGIRKGRFGAHMDPLFARFNASVAFDRRLYAQDIDGSIAHVRMLAKQGIVSLHDARAIEQGLEEIRREIEEGQLELKEELEDIHINIEQRLREKVGDVAGRLHTARSRNDQVALDVRMYVREQNELVSADLASLMTALVNAGERTADLILPGYTHLQRAQPVRLGHHIMAYFQMFRRDWERFQDALRRNDEMPLGSAALAGTTFSIDRSAVAEALGFSRLCANSMDAVSDRDFVAEILFNASMVMMHLSRLSEELIIWSSAEFGFCSLPDAFCSGSSIMPQKKNPDACELIRGKTGRVYGDLIALLTMLKALPLTYNKDLQEDKEPLFDAVDTVRGCIGIMAGLVPGIAFDGERMLQAASDPTLAATDLADGLARAGVPFREAHERIGASIRRGAQPNGGRDTVEALPKPQSMVEARNHEGGTARVQVMAQVEAARSFLKRNAARSSIQPEHREERKE